MSIAAISSNMFLPLLIELISCELLASHSHAFLYTCNFSWLNILLINRILAENVAKEMEKDKEKVKFKHKQKGILLYSLGIFLKFVGITQ